VCSAYSYSCSYESSSVGIALGYGLDDRVSRVRFPAEAGKFSHHHRVQNGSGSHPASIQWVPGALSLRVKRPGRESDHSPPSSAEVNKAWSYTSTPQYVFMAWCLVKHRDNFTLFVICLCIFIRVRWASFTQINVNTNFIDLSSGLCLRLLKQHVSHTSEFMTGKHTSAEYLTFGKVVPRGLKCDLGTWCGVGFFLRTNCAPFFPVA
jgi:hypothetical protein